MIKAPYLARAWFADKVEEEEKEIEQVDAGEPIEDPEEQLTRSHVAKVALNPFRPSEPARLL